jgi:hypothetical protein
MESNHHFSLPECHSYETATIEAGLATIVMPVIVLSEQLSVEISLMPSFEL